MTNEILIQQLKKIKMSILLGAGGGVTDTAWMVNAAGRGETICERIDSLLESLDCDMDAWEREQRMIQYGAVK